MKVLLLTALYPPLMLGGAENSARNLADWLAKRGVSVAVVRATDTDEPEGMETSATGVSIYRIRTPHIYAPFRFPQAPAWKKPLWHLQDHLDPRSAAKVGRILEEFAPDLVNVHMIQGIGYPVLRELARRKIPVNYVLPDLGLACIRMNMFKNGEDCARQCTACKLSSRYKLALIRGLSRVGFVSPSRANIETLARFFPVRDYPNAVLLNANAYPLPTVARSTSSTLRLFYAGRIHSTKGVDMLLAAVEDLAQSRDISLTIAGQGPQEAELRAKYADKPWCNFLGFLSQQDLANIMMQSDLLCIPSIWAENSPGVVIQALGLGLPVLGSDRGGIGELVLDGVNGRLVTVQTVEAWREAIHRVLLGKEPLAEWSDNARAQSDSFGQDALGEKALAWMQDIAGIPSSAMPDAPHHTTTATPNLTSAYPT
jgi:glycosyltransferase involved in cell wall biosynthesis